MSEIEIRQKAAKEGQRGTGKGKRGDLPLHIGLAGALIWLYKLKHNFFYFYMKILSL